MAENLPVHMSNNEEEIIDNELDLSELFNNEEEIQYDSAWETRLDSDVDEVDDKFQAPLVPQQRLIPSWQQPHLHPRLFYSSRDQTRCIIRPPELPAIVLNTVHQGVYTPKGQNTETEIELCKLFFDNATLESIKDFTNIKIGLLYYLL